ncbi:hypothetical protein IKF74_01120 [Candidatus Saccharibacteria bacterium]|nr:hypothetical protein [Candidatus Saccharibacteria bacterium]
MEKDKSNNKMVVALLAVLIVAVLGVGGYFVVKDLNSKKSDDSSQEQGGKDDKKDSGQDDPTPTPDPEPTPTPDPEPTPAPSEIEAGITYSEIRSNDFYVEVQVSGQVAGTCDISVTPTSGGQGHHDTDDLEIQNKVSLCNESFSLKGMNKGEHLVKVIIYATDGRTKTLEKTVNI